MRPRRALVVLGTLAAATQALAAESPPSAPVPPPSPKPSATPIPKKKLSPPPQGVRKTTPKGGVARPARPARSPFWDRLYLDVYGYGGYASPTIQEGYASATQLHFGLGTTAAYRIPWSWLESWKFNLAAGAALFDYRTIGQYSEVVEAIGNTKGSRFILFSPLLLVSFAKRYTLKLEMQFLGSYHLSKKTVDNQDLNYNSPSGFRGTFLYPLSVFLHQPVFSHIQAGVETEYAKFGSREITQVSTKSLEPPLTVWQTGIVVAYVF